MLEYDEMSSRPPAWYPALEDLLKHDKHAEATRAVEDVLARCRESSDDMDTAQALRAVAMMQLWDKDEAANVSRGVALAEEAVALSRKAGDTSGEAAALHLASKFHMGSGQFEDASRVAGESLAKCRALQDKIAEAYVLNTVARISITRGEAAEGVRLTSESLSLFEEEDDIRGQISALQTFFRVHIASDDRWQTIIVMDELVGLHRRLGDAVGEGTAKVLGAQYHMDVGSPQEALPRAKQAAELFKREGLDKKHGSALLCAAAASVSMGEFESGQVLIDEVMEVFRRIKDLGGQGAASSILANSHRMQEEFRKAANRFEDAATFYGQEGDKAAKANAMREVATCLGKMLANDPEVPEGGWRPDDLEEPLRAAKTSASLFQEIQDTDSQAYAFALQQLSNCLLLNREYSEAIMRGQESLRIFEREGNYQGAAGAYGSLAQAFALKGESSEALSLAKEGLKWARRAADDHHTEFLLELIRRYTEAAAREQHSAATKVSTGARGEGASDNSLYRNAEPVVVYSDFQGRRAKVAPQQKPRHEEEAARAPMQESAKVVYQTRVVRSPGAEPELRTITRPSERRAKAKAESAGPLEGSEAAPVGETPPSFEPGSAESSHRVTPPSFEPGSAERIAG